MKKHLALEVQTTNINASARKSVSMMAVRVIWNTGQEIIRNEAEILAEEPKYSAQSWS